ncbi:MAG: Tetratricopeptide TPR_2 repeat protein [Candidatus Moranbacteria bacterium GW2011_GWE2_35_164]|nr:MAG: Tetratricopeptide TPR_2 repeat protein [Candidatus Moranbacteria bacterium GW2011_GWE2_35_164]
MADIYARAHNEKAIDAYKNLTASDSSNINNYILLALAYAEKGLKEQEQGRDRQEYISNALVIIEEAKKIDNNNSEVYRIEAYVNEIKPDYSQALVLYDKAIEIDDKNIFAYAGKGHTERMLGMLEESVDNFNKAAKLDTDKNYVFIYTNLCSLEYSRGNSEIAFENCKIVTDKKDIDPVFQSNAHQTMAIILMRNNDIVQAENNLLKAKTLTPNDPNLFITLSKLNIFEKKYSESEVNAKRAIEFSPTSANAYLALAHALYMEEKFSESIMNAEKGVSLVKDDVSLLNPSKPVVERDLNYSIANCYREMGNIEKQEEFEEKAKNLLNNNK